MATIQVKDKPVSTVTVEDNTKSLNGKADVPLLLSFPHSGEDYPDDFEANPELPFEILDFPNDKYVDELYHVRSEVVVYPYMLIFLGLILMSIAISIISM